MHNSRLSNNWLLVASYHASYQPVIGFLEKNENKVILFLFSFIKVYSVLGWISYLGDNYVILVGYYILKVQYPAIRLLSGYQKSIVD
jgi:hypothetical protein